MKLFLVLLSFVSFSVHASFSSNVHQAYRDQARGMSDEVLARELTSTYTKFLAALYLTPDSIVEEITSRASRDQAHAEAILRFVLADLDGVLAPASYVNDTFALLLPLAQKNTLMSSATIRAVFKADRNSNLADVPLATLREFNKSQIKLDVAEMSNDLRFELLSSMIKRQVRPSRFSVLVPSLVLSFAAAPTETIKVADFLRANASLDLRAQLLKESLKTNQTQIVEYCSRVIADSNIQTQVEYARLSVDFAIVRQYGGAEGAKLVAQKMQDVQAKLAEWRALENKELAQEIFASVRNDNSLQNVADAYSRGNITADAVVGGLRNVLNSEILANILTKVGDQLIQICTLAVENKDQAVASVCVNELVPKLLHTPSASPEYSADVAKQLVVIAGRFYDGKSFALTCKAFNPEQDDANEVAIFDGLAQLSLTYDDHGRGKRLPLKIKDCDAKAALVPAVLQYATIGNRAGITLDSGAQEYVFCRNEFDSAYALVKDVESQLPPELAWRLRVYYVHRFGGRLSNQISLSEANHPDAVAATCAQINPKLKCALTRSCGTGTQLVLQYGSEKPAHRKLH